MADEEYEAEAADSHLSEAEKAMQAAKKRQDDEDAAKLAEYEEQRRIQREKDEEEIRMLKEKQERRKKEREQEEIELAERLKEAEERARVEEEARRAKHEEEKRKKEEEKKKRQAGMNQFKTDGGPNFQIPAEGERKAHDDKMSQFDKFGNIVKAKQEMGLTKEQQEELKKRVMADILKPLSLDGMDLDAIRHKVKELHARLSRLESDRYDLEKRAERQTYDLKELNERQRQINRNKALKKGLDPDVLGSSRHPPKIVVSSKYDRQTDRRSFTDRRGIFDKPKSYPHFPNVPPPPSELVKVVAGEGGHGEGGGGGHSEQGNEDQEEQEEAEEEEEEEEEEE